MVWSTSCRGTFSLSFSPAHAFQNGARTLFAVRSLFSRSSQVKSKRQARTADWQISLKRFCSVLTQSFLPVAVLLTGLLFSQIDRIAQLIGGSDSLEREKEDREAHRPLLQRQAHRLVLALCICLHYIRQTNSVTSNKLWQVVGL